MIPPENALTRFGISRQAKTAVVFYGCFLLLIFGVSLNGFDPPFLLIILAVCVAWYRRSSQHAVLLDRDKAVVQQRGASTEMYWRDVGEIHVWQDFRGQLRKIALRKKDFRGVTTLSEFENLPTLLELVVDHAPDAVRVKPHFTLGSAYSPGVAVGVGVVMTAITYVTIGYLT